MCYFDRDASTRLDTIIALPYKLATTLYKTTEDTTEGRVETLAYIANFGRCKWLDMSAASPIRLEGVLAQAQADPMPNSPPFYIMCQLSIIK